MKMNEPNDTKLPRTSSSESDGCMILESDIPIINLDSSMDEGKDLLDCGGNGCTNESILKIQFKDEATYIELSSVITSCIKNALFYLQKSVLFTEDSTNLTVTFDETSNTDDGLFIVDSAPSTMPSTTDFIPEYSRCGVGINDPDLEAKKDGTPTASKSAQNTCFNCDGEHSIKDCTKPKDLNKIKQNRAKFSSNKLSYERYHVDVEQRFGHLVAGELTNDLRSALGLRSKELPEHIYRMREIGYPPGWLKHAQVSHSGLSMFGTQGKDDNKIDEDDEDKYDLNKILSFPGFNVEPPSGTFDKSREFRSMHRPMDPRNSKAAMVELLRNKSTKAYKRKTMKITQDADVTVLIPTDMDIDDENDNDVQISPVDDVSIQLPCLPIPECLPTTETSSDSEPPIPGTECQSPLSDGEIVDTELKRPCSPSLDDLNERKKRLLAALDDSTVSLSIALKEEPLPLTTLKEEPLPLTTLNSTANQDDSLIEDIMALHDSSLEASQISEKNGDCSKLDDSSLSMDSPHRPKQNLVEIGKSPSMHTSKGTVCGTPVIKGVSPYSNLPRGEKWAAGVTDMLDFENLPESIGKYEKMRKVIGKVRAKVKQIQYEDDDDE